MRAIYDGMSKINVAFRMARLAARIPQRELARTLGVTAGFLSSIESGNARLPLRLYSKLPDEIRGPVIGAAIAELRDQIDKLEAIR